MPLQGRGLERLDVLGRERRAVGREQVPLLVEQRGAEHRDRLEALAVRLGGDQPVDDVLGERLARLVVHGVVGEDLGPPAPTSR